MFYIVYQTTNKINSKIYIGKHKTAKLDDGYLGSGKILRYAIAKYGVENFTYEILHCFDNVEEMNIKEREIVNEEFLKRNDVYNLKLGGDGGFDYINQNIITAEFRKIRGCNGAKLCNRNTERGKIGRSKHMTKLCNLRHKLGTVSIPNTLGMKYSEDSRKRMSTSGTSENNSQFGTMWITNGSQNKKLKKLDPMPIGWYRGRCNIPV